MRGVLGIAEALRHDSGYSDARWLKNVASLGWR
jgi:hypothetical protein